MYGESSLQCNFSRSNDSPFHLESMVDLECCPINYYKFLKPYWEFQELAAASNTKKRKQMSKESHVIISI